MMANAGAWETDTWRAWLDIHIQARMPAFPSSLWPVEDEAELAEKCFTAFEMATILASPLEALDILTTILPIAFVNSFAAVLKRANLSLSVLATGELPFGELSMVPVVGLLYLHFQAHHYISEHVGD